jgi:hypothetical protein
MNKQDLNHITYKHMTIAQAKEYDRWWTQNSYKYKDGIPPSVQEAWIVLAKTPQSLPAKNVVKVPKRDNPKQELLD